MRPADVIRPRRQQHPRQRSTPLAAKSGGPARAREYIGVRGVIDISRRKKGHWHQADSSQDARDPAEARTAPGRRCWRGWFSGAIACGYPHVARRKHRGAEQFGSVGRNFRRLLCGDRWRAGDCRHFLQSTRSGNGGACKGTPGSNGGSGRFRRGCMQGIHLPKAARLSTTVAGHSCTRAEQDVLATAKHAGQPGGAGCPNDLGPHHAGGSGVHRQCAFRDLDTQVGRSGQPVGCAGWHEAATGSCPHCAATAGGGPTGARFADRAARAQAAGPADIATGTHCRRHGTTSRCSPLAPPGNPPPHRSRNRTKVPAVLHTGYPPQPNRHPAPHCLP